MAQVFKSIYFTDHPAIPPNQRHVRLAFGEKDHYLYDRIKSLSSEQIRQLIGIESFDGLETYSRNNALSLNRACLSLLHQTIQTNSLNTNKNEQIGILSDPLIATYRGGNGEALHNWYAFLEGFSPRFVRTVLDIYAPNAKRILDPFAGTGTTPLTVATLGLTGYYCEVNPALQVVCDIKNRILQLRENIRTDLADQLGDLDFRVNFQLQDHDTDEILRDNYYRAFSGSNFFDEETFEEVLRLRTWADELAVQSQLIGHIFTVAVIASLVQSSLMVRKGDLRYKTPKELLRNRVSIKSAVTTKLEEMAKDILAIDNAPGYALLVAEDAQLLAHIPRLNIDCIITSPPYLNGTNYFRNTKLELWFLRVLTKPTDLRFWRFKAFTAGINDVTKAKCGQPHPPEVNEVVEKLRKSAYDSRIPMMVASYFREFDQLFRAISSHINSGTIYAIDIGDSRYGGIHVETDKLLSQIAKKHGYMEINTHTLRARKSPDGGLLQQKLLVFEYRDSKRPKTLTPMVPSFKARPLWEEFKNTLPHQSAPFNKRNWGHPLHSICSYGGKLKPSIAHFLVDYFVPKDGVMLDPFAGAGTIPFEACLQGKQAYGFEISNAAFTVANAKLHQPNREAIETIVSSLDDFISNGQITEQELNRAKKIAFNRSLDEYYHQDTFKEILLARTYFSEQKSQTVEYDFVLACLLHILHGNRPYALSRRSHPITPFAPTGQYEYRSLIKKLQAKVTRSLGVTYPEDFHEGQMYFQDATNWWPPEVNKLDAVITSPPFFNSTRFYLANWIRLWFCGWERIDFDKKPMHFLEIRQQKSMTVYESVLRQARERLKSNGVVILHLGKSKKCDMAQELCKIAAPWFKKIDLFEESVLHCESHGIRDKGTVVNHQYLVLG